jgi:hypothetical protein
MRNLLPSLAAAFLSVLAGAPLAAQGAFDPAAGLIRLADANGDGDVVKGEWAAFLTGLDAAEDGALDPRAILARIAFRDLDGDGRFAASDVESALAPDAPPSLTRFFLQALADRDASGDVSAAERDAFLALPAVAATPAGEALAPDALIGWIRAIEALPPPPADDRGRRVPPVVLAGMLPVLDADSNGTLTVDDLNGLQRGADADGDGDVTAEELRGRQGPTFARWDVDPEVKARPPLMPWQRSLADALLLVERTQKPLLVCVNMDDENASEVLAWNRYRDPAFARLAGGFVCVLASPDRREPLEYDDRGRRLFDRRFGRLVNSEHIDIEPQLFERFFHGMRVAPRHVGVAPDGTVLFDLYLLQDLSLVDAKLREFGKPDVPTAPPPASLSDEELLASPDAACRDELERRFVAADEPARAQLLAGALAEHRPFQHPELLRLALRDVSPGIRTQAVGNLLRSPALFPLELVPESFAVAAGWTTRSGESAPAVPFSHQIVVGLRAAATEADAAGDAERARDARFFARVYSAIDAPSRHLDPARWRVMLAGEKPAPRPDYAQLDYDTAIAQLDAVERALTGNSDDVAVLGRRADVLARIARIRMATAENPLYFLQDVERAADDVIARAPFDARALALKAWSLYHLNKVPEAAIAATLALPHLARQAADPATFEVLDILATAKTREIYDAIEAGRPWGDEAIPDACAAYAVLCAHPDATDAHRVRFLELLGALRAYPQQRAVARAALAAWPASEQLHAWLRFVELRDGGSRALEEAYADLFQDVAPSLEPTIAWFRGLAELFAAEHDVQCRDAAAAREAYARSRGAFEESLAGAPGFAPTVAHYSALGLSGLARLELADGRIDAALAAATDALRAAPRSAESQDGLGKSPLDTAREVCGALERADRAGEADALRGAARELGLELELEPGGV